WTGNALRAGIGRVIVYIGRKRKPAGQRINAAKMPAAKGRANRAIAKVGARSSKRQFIIEAQHPAQLLIKVCPAFLCREIVPVLGKRGVAADFWKVVDSFAIGECAKEIQPVSCALLGFYLQRVVRGTGDIGHSGKPAELRKWSARLNISRPRCAHLVRIDYALQVRSLRTRVRDFQAEGRRQRALYRQIPSLVVRSVQVRIDTGHSRIDRLARIERWKSLRNCNHRGYAIADECRLVEERQVIGQLQRRRRTNFLAAIENSIRSPNHRVSALSWSPSKPKARRKVRFVSFNEAPGSSVLSRDDDCVCFVIEVTLAVV